MNTEIKDFGECRYDSPAGYNHYTSDDERVLFDSHFTESDFNITRDSDAFELAGPRQKIYHNSSEVTAGIVTCGGLCPGINDVIRSLVMELHYRYNVKKIYGFRYGYAGMVKKNHIEPEILTPEKVVDIMNYGGSILASSRGGQSKAEMADYLQELGVNMLFTVGGDGTQKGASELTDELEARNAEISVIGIPKTIDNDINYIEKTFGFSTAFTEAVKAVNCGHVEAVGAPMGIGLVKLMGRHSGFIAAQAALASKHVNYVLIPEVDFDLEGPGGFLEDLKERMLRRKHAVVLVAEGAGQKFFDDSDLTDASGNKKLKDIGPFLKDRISDYFKKQNIDINLKYIDPSYIIRSVPATAEDSAFCSQLAQNAVHAAMAGKTDMLVGLWNGTFTHVPISLAVKERKRLNVDGGKIWQTVLASTGQRASMKADV